MASLGSLHASVILGQQENKNAEPKFHLSNGLMHKQLASQIGLA